MQPNLRVARALLKATLSLPRPVLRAIAGPPRVSTEGYTLDLHTQVLLRAMATAKVTVDQLPPKAARKLANEGQQALDLARDARAGVRVHDTELHTTAGMLPVRVYRPRGAAPRPGLVYFHGGGWVIGSLDTHDGMLHALSARTGRVVVSVDYRLAPEHAFPSAVDDAVAAFRAVIAAADALEIAADNVVVGGDSAGGNMAAVAALETAHDPQPPVAQLLIYPATELTYSTDSHEQFRDGPFLPRSLMDYFLQHYAPDPSSLRASVLRAPPETLRHVAPAYVVTAGFDPLRDEGDAYATRLEEAGVKVWHRCATTLIHGFVTMAGVIPEAANELEHIVQALRKIAPGRRVVSHDRPRTAAV